MNSSVIKGLIPILLLITVGAGAFAQCTGVPSGMVTGNISVGSNIVTVSNTTGFAAGMPISGAGIPPGTTVVAIINGSVFTMSASATASGVQNITTHSLVPNGNWLPPSVPAGITPTTNWPPLGPTWGSPATSTCLVCPSTFTGTICGNNYATVYLCQGNEYTFSLCTSDPANDFSLSMVTTTFTAIPAGYSGEVFDDDGCGVVNGPSELTFSPQVSGQYNVRILEDPCEFNAALCGTLVITWGDPSIGMQEPGSTGMDLRVAPNPVTDLLIVNSNLVGETDWLILDATGRRMLHGRSMMGGTIDASALAQGAYALVARDAGGKTLSTRFVKE